MTRITVFSAQRYDGDWLPEKLDDAIAWLREKLGEIPAEYQDSAEIEIDSVGSYEDSHYASITIQYDRPSTPEEIAAIDAERRKRLTADIARHEQWARLARAQLADPKAR